MPESIETFVRKLQEEGVEAGKNAAEKLIEEAKQQTETIIQEARRQASELLADTQTEANKITEQHQNELDLATRDALLQLQENITSSVQVILENEVRTTLSSPTFLADLIRDVMLQYARQDVQHQDAIEIRVPPETVQQVKDLALERLRQNEGSATKFSLHSTLKKQGFEYTVRESTVEVTVESITEFLSKMVTEQVRDSLRKAVANK